MLAMCIISLLVTLTFPEALAPVLTQPAPVALQGRLLECMEIEVS
jgi:hypothetical protein